jgi:hypothetical protein
MRVTIFEGSPEEYAKVRQHLETATPSTTSESATESRPANQSAGDEGPVTTLEARAILSRRPLSPAMKTLFRELYKAKDRKVGAAHLIKVMGLDPNTNQFAGAMGAFGRRHTHTPNVRPRASFFISEWQRDPGQWAYSLPPTVRAALEQEGVV